MSYISAYYTDIGPFREKNQDALCIKSFEYKDNIFIMCAICDGMGGLSDGEAASSYAIYGLSEWFDNILTTLIRANTNILEIRKKLDEHIHRMNENINAYSSSNLKMLGTTLTAMFIFPDLNKILTAHVGDTRAYKITNENISIITEDHSIVGEEVREGLLTEEMANNDERQNQLTKCLGADFTDISYDYILQEYEHDVCYMLYSDGFRKKLTNNEIQKNLCPLRITDKESSENILKNLTKTVITRGETDNITSLIVKIV